MNTKGIKFLAVLAVLAMAFAAFAIVSDSQTDDASTALPTSKDYKIGSDDVTALGNVSEYEAITAASKYVVTTGTAVIADKTGTTDATVYLLPSTAVKFTAVTAGSVTIIPATADTSKNLTALGISLKVTAGTDAQFATDANGNVTFTGKATIGVSKISSQLSLIIDKDAALTVADVLTNDGTIINKAGKDNYANGSLLLNNANSSIVSTSASAKGVIKGTNEPLVMMTIGTLKNQVIDSRAYTSEEDLDQSLYISQEGKIEVTGCDFKLASGSSYGIYATVGAYDFEISGNTFDADNGKIRKAIIVNVTDAKAVAVIKQNDFSKASYDLTAGKDGDLVITQPSLSASIGTLDSGANVQIDSTITSMALDGNSTYPYSVKDSISVKTLSIRSGAVLSVSSSTKIVNNGIIINKGTISGTGSIEGTGAIDNFGTLSVADGTTHQVYCQVNLYGGSTWSAGGFVYAANTGASLINFGSEAKNTVLYVKHTQTMSSGAITAATYEIVKDVVLTNGSWIASNTYPENITIASSAALTLASTTDSDSDEVYETTIGSNATVILEEGAKFVGGSKQLLIVEGKLTYADATQAYTNVKVRTNAEVKVAGSGGSSEKVVTDTETKVVDDKTFTNADVVVTTAAVTSADVPAGKELVITETSGLTASSVLDASADNAKISIVTTSAATFSLKVSDKPIAVTGFTGTATFSKGSIVINGVDSGLTAGTFTLNDGDVVKISGNVTNVTFNYTATSGSATVLVEAGDEKALNLSGTMTIGSKRITLDIEGQVTGGTIANDEAAVNIKSGAVVKTTAITGTKGAITVYSGSDINAIGAISSWSKVIGKDDASGTWTYNDADKELTLSNYNGTYNFKTFANTDGFAKVTLIGDNVVSYESDENGNFTLFGSASSSLTSISTVQGSASLTLNVDVSKIEKDNLDGGVIIVDAAALSIDAVDVYIAVSGTNSDWDEKSMAEAKFIGIDATSVKLYNSDLDLSIMAAFVAKDSYGIKSDGVVDISSCADIEILSAGTAIDAKGDVSIKDTLVTVTGQVLGMKATGGMTISNYAALTVSNGLEAGDEETDEIKVLQESVITVDNLTLAGEIINNGSIVLTGSSIVMDTGAIQNFASISNSGTIGVYGSIINGTLGQFNNAGAVNVYSYTLPTADIAVQMADEAATSTGDVAKLYKITIDDKKMKQNADGSFAISDATIAFQKVKGTSLGDLTGFEGSLTYNQTTGSYTLVLSDGTAAISVAYDASKTATGDDVIGKAYSVSLSGSVVYSDVAYTLETNTSSDKIDSDSIKTTVAATASLTVSGGTFTNDGTVVLYQSAKPVDEKGEFKGDFTTYAAATEMAGKMTGNITSSKTDGTVTISGTLTGDISAKGDVTVTKTMTGNITSTGNVAVNDSSAKLTGNVIMENSTKEKTLTVNGTIKGTLTYNTKYNTATSGTAVNADFTATMDLDGTAPGMVITAKNGANATASTSATGGYFALTTAPALATGKTMDLKLTSGKFGVVSSVVLPVSYTLTIESGSTIEVAKVASFTINGGLKVSNGATKNYELVTIPVTYGKLIYVMTFDIAEGYTVYSNVEYALSNCDENSELTVGAATKVENNIAIKAGVNVIVKDVKLDLSDVDLSMAEGAKITLVGTGNIAFAATGDEKEDEVTTLHYVNGTFVYDENIMTFEDVRFDVASTLVGTAATSSAASKLTVALSFNEGIATLVKGNAAGTIALKNANYKLNDVEMKVSADYVISSGTVSEAAVTDAAQTYTDATKKTISKPATTVSIDGTMKANANMTILGAYGGDGMLFVADGRSVTITGSTTTTDGAALAIEIGNDAGSFTFLSSDVTAVVTAVAKTSTTDAYVKISGKITDGSVVSKLSVATESLELGYKAATTTTEQQLGTLAVPEGASLVVLNSYTLTANGLLMVAGDIYYKTEILTTYGELKYEITYEQGGYTVYSMLTNALDLILPGTEIAIEKNLNVEDNTIPAGVSIVIADGYYLTVKANSYLIIGEGITSLGAAAVLSGDIYLAEGAYIIDYAGSNSNISVYTSNVGDVLSGEAKQNTFLVLDSAYATVYAEDDLMFSKSDATNDTINITLINPKIDGYYFSEWQLQNGNSVVATGAAGATTLSEGPFNAYMVASKVSVTFKGVAGVDYYVDGVMQNVLDAPVKVAYGATVTAKISDITVYQGTPLVNGKAYVIIDDSVSNVTGSGVSPIPEPTPTPTPEPTPEPTKSDWGITEILLVVLVILIAIMCVVVILRLNRS